MQAAIQQAASSWQVQNMSPDAAAGSVASALQQLQKDSQQQKITSKHVKGIEAKLNALEGSVLTAGMTHSCTKHSMLVCSIAVKSQRKPCSHYIDSASYADL